VPRATRNGQRPENKAASSVMGARSQRAPRPSEPRAGCRQCGQALRVAQPQVNLRWPCVLRSASQRKSAMAAGVRIRTEPSARRAAVPVTEENTLSRAAKLAKTRSSSSSSSPALSTTTLCGPRVTHSNHGRAGALVP
jgi:hypothetical protein